MADNILLETAQSIAQEAANRYGATQVVIETADGSGYEIVKAPAPKGIVAVKTIRPTR